VCEFTGNKGFTLVEAIVSLTIFVLAVSAVLTVYLQGYAGYLENNQKIEVQEGLRIALNRISRDLRQAKSEPEIFKQDGSLSRDGTGSKISFLTASGETVTYSFDRRDRELEVRRGAAGSFQPVVSHIEDLEFQFDSDKKIVAIYIRGKKHNSNPPVVYEMKTKVQARARKAGV
jgi:prepilin-type N-terminal cleavage/methylation domain-containing protein